MENLSLLLDISLLILFILVALFTAATGIGIIIYTRKLNDFLEKIAYITSGVIILTISLLIITCLVTVINY